MKKPPRIISKCKLEYMYDGSKNWLDNYIEDYIKKKGIHPKRSVMFSTESKIYTDNGSFPVITTEVYSPQHSIDENSHENSPDSLETLEDDEFCGHTGCSFVYNVQGNCLERSSFVMESVPFMTYVKLAPLLDMDPHKSLRTDETNRCKLGPLEEEDRLVDEFIHLVEKELGIRSDASMDAQVEIGTNRNSIRDNPILSTSTLQNPYLKYLKRSGSKAQGTRKWNTLGRRSKEITQTIINDFLDWYSSLGVEDEESNVDETILQDLFQIGFDSPTARAIALRIKEMPVVPESLAYILNEPKFAVKKGLKMLVKMDIKLEQKPKKLIAFGTMLSKEEPCLRFQPPRNNVKATWTECKRVPPELESLKVVWEGIENLRSTIAFCNWLKEHPHITPPRYLKEKNLLNINYEEWMQIFQGFEKEVDTYDIDAETIQRESTDDSLSTSKAIARNPISWTWSLPHSS